MKLSRFFICAFLFTAFFILFTENTFAQKRKISRKASQSSCTTGQSDDFRIAGLYKPSKAVNQAHDLGDGLQGEPGCGSVIITIPGEYMDSLSGSRAQPISLQLAAAVFIKANNTSDNTIDEALKNSFIKSERVRRAGDMTIVYLFRIKNGRIARIFTYTNEIMGLLGVLEISPK